MAVDGIFHTIYLEPFIHQVSGRSSMLTMDDHTICKPLISRELTFYESLPESLKPFVPEFRGVIDASFVEDSNGYLMVETKMPIQENVCSRVSIEHRPAKKRIRVNTLSGIEIECCDAKDAEKFHDGYQKNCGESIHNPWVLKCHRDHFNKMKTCLSLNYVQKFILLENLTAKYRFPCVLDLKMGTKLYDDEASMRKRVSQDAKVEATTSGTLGVRICGMQVYHVDCEYFLCHNKYHGRTLSVEGFRQTLYKFLHNGIRLRRDVLTDLLNSLQCLRSVVQHLDTFRFFTSSLLVIYDGKDNNLRRHNTPIYVESENKNRSEKDNFVEKSMENDKERCLNRQGGPLVDIRMIDFAHSVVGKERGPDDGYIYGLDNLIEQLKLIEQDAELDVS